MASTGPKTCPECAGLLPAPTGRGKPRVFCSDKCKQDHANRMTVRGKMLAKVALGWRQTRGSGDLGKFLFAEMTSMLDKWNSEDREANRGRADEYAATVVEFNATNPQWSSRFFDRQPAKARGAVVE